MKSMIFILVLFPAIAFSQFCASPFEGKWSCDTRTLGDQIEIKVIPPGHGFPNGLISIIDLQNKITEMTSPLDNTWTSDADYYSVKGSCTPDNAVKIEYKDREIEMQKTNGSVYLKFATGDNGPTGKVELWIKESLQFHNGGGAQHTGICKPIL